MKWMSQKHVDLGSGSVGRLLLSLAAPTITSQIVNMLYNLVDRVYIGHMQPTDTVGKLALTGVGVCLPVILIISAFAALMAMGGAPRASIQEGRGNSREAERIMGNSFTLVVFASLILTLVFRLCTGLFKYLCNRHYFRTSNSWYELLYYSPGLYDDWHENGAHWRCFKHDSGPHLYFWARYGRTGCGPGHGFISGRVGGMGFSLFGGSPDPLAPPP